MKIETDKNSTVFLDLSKQVVGDMRTRVEESGRTHAALADILHVDRSAISKTLNENTNLTLRKVAEIAAATGSRCYFRMTRDANLDDLPSAMSLVSSSTGSGPNKKRRGLNPKGLLDEAAQYIRDLSSEGTFIDADEVHVFVQDDVDSFLGGEFEKDFDAFIYISPEDEGLLSTSTEIAVTVEHSFSDGFSEVEWVLNDLAGVEYFRSRDLRQVAELALIVLSRGGFKN